MIILTLRTDRPEAELGLFEENKQLAYESWQAHRELAETIQQKINEILNKASKKLEDVQGIVVYEGPGSFTGLRIGFSVANALAYALGVPIVATSDDNWQEDGIRKLLSGKNDKIALPNYGSPPHVTKQRK